MGKKFNGYFSYIHTHGNALQVNTISSNVTRETNPANHVQRYITRVLVYQMVTVGSQVSPGLLCMLLVC